MKKLKRRLRARAGMTLTELLAAIAILSLLGVAIGAGTSAALKVYRASTVLSEAGVLRSTLAAAVADELRYATDIDGSADPVTYWSDTYGKGASIKADADGRLTVGSEPLVGSKTYSSGLTAAVQITYKDEVFDVTLTVSEDGGYENEVRFSVNPINE